MITLLISVTIVTDTSTDADGISNNTLLDWKKDWNLLIISVNEVEAVFIDSENNIYLLNYLKNKFEVIDEKFKVIE